jgi:hypothetical protein
MASLGWKGLNDTEHGLTKSLQKSRVNNVEACGEKFRNLRQ